jgi:hypothetical protein
MGESASQISLLRRRQIRCIEGCTTLLQLQYNLLLPSACSVLDHLCRAPAMTRTVDDTRDVDTGVADLYSASSGDEPLLQSDWFLFGASTAIVLLMELPMLLLLLRVRARHAGTSMVDHLSYVAFFAANLAFVFFDFATDIVQLLRILLISSDAYCKAASSLAELSGARARARAVLRTKALRGYMLSSSALLLFITATTLTFACAARIWASQQQSRRRHMRIRAALGFSYLCIVCLAALGTVEVLRFSSWDFACAREQRWQHYASVLVLAGVLTACVLVTMHELLFPAHGHYAEVHEVAKEVQALILWPWRHAQPDERRPSRITFTLLVLAGVLTLPLTLVWTALMSVVAVVSALGIALCLSDGEVVMDMLRDLTVVDERDGPWDFWKILTIADDIGSTSHTAEGFAHAHRRFVVLHAVEFVAMISLQVSSELL